MTGVRVTMVTGAATLLLAAAPQGPQRAALDALNARLLAGPTATLALGKWCAEHGVDAPVRAEIVPGGLHFATLEQRARLKVGPNEPLGYRRVRLSCGGHVLSEAENWYIPSRLTAAMNQALDTSDTPFGAVIAPLKPSRRNLGAELLWQGEGEAPEGVLRHRALVLDGTGRPLAEVVETYKRSALEIGGATD